MLLLLLLLPVAVALAVMYARSVQCGADFPKDATVAVPISDRLRR